MVNNRAGAKHERTREHRASDFWGLELRPCAKERPAPEAAHSDQQMPRSSTGPSACDKKARPTDRCPSGDSAPAGRAVALEPDSALVPLRGTQHAPPARYLRE